MEREKQIKPLDNKFMRQNIAKALLNFAKVGVSAEFLITLASKVANNLRDNAYFPEMKDKAIELKDRATEYIAAVSKAASGNRTDIQIANQQKAALQTSLKNICTTVNYVANSDRMKLTTTGFDLSKDFRTNVVLNPITGFVVSQGDNAGELQTAFSTQKGIQGTGVDYCLTANPTPETLWVTKANGSSAKMILTNLNPGATITLRAWATGPREQKIYSQNISTVVGYNKSVKMNKRKAA